MRLDAHYGMLPERAFEKRGFGNTRPATLEGGGKGGGGGGQPTQSTVYNTNIPEYAKPYVTSMLGATARQLFEGTEKPSGEYEITGFRQYQPYSTDPTKYFAGPSSLQRSVYGEAGQMQTPGQFGGATNLAGAAGMGQLGTAQQAGTLGGLGTALGAAGAMQAMPAFQAGQQFMQGVTDPSRVGQFMSPYQQQVTDIAKAAAVRDAQMLEQGNRLAAARQGTYGGARQALASLERERNLATNLANIQAQGSQAAYDKALQQMQFGSNLGLQGIQTGLQGVQAGMQGIGQGLQGVGAQQAGFAGAGQAAATLGGLGTQEQQADLARMGFQQQIGKAQQEYQQNIINQAVQDYATAQQYPLMQLGFMSNMLRGLPLQATSTQSYMAQPSFGQQALGLAGAYGAYKGMFREGGEVKHYVKGGGVKASLENRLDDIAEAGGVRGLQKLMGETQSQEAKKVIAEKIRELGIAAAPTGDLGTRLAGGGIVAFQNTGLVEDPLMQFSGLDTEGRAEDELRLGKIQREKDIKQYNFLKEVSPVAAQRMLEKDPSLDSRAPATAVSPAAAPAAAPAGANQPPAGGAPAGGTPTAGLGAMTPEKFMEMREGMYKSRGIAPGMGERGQALMDYLAAQEGKMGERYGEAGRMNKALAILKGSQDPRGLLAGAVTGGQEFLKGEAAMRKEQRAEEMQLKKAQADLESAQRKEAKGDIDGAMKDYESYLQRTTQLESAKISAGAAGQATRFEKDAIDQVMKDNPGMSYLQALQAVRGAGRFEPTSVQAIKTQLADIAQQIVFAGKDEKLKKELIEKRAALNKRLEEISGTSTAGAAAPASGKVDRNNPLLKG